MAKHIGIVACSAEGAALCYKTICREAAAEMGEHMHPEISMHTYPLGLYVPLLNAGEWKGVAELMLSSVRKVANMGADFAISPDNTIHQVYDMVVDRSPIPWLHIAESVGLEARRRGFDNLAILGTKYLMTGPVYPEALERLGISSMIPDSPERERMNEIIFTQLVYGNFSQQSRHYFNEIIQKLKDRGAGAAVLGCTEIPLLVDPDDCPLPTLDSTRILARAALREALK